MNMSQKLMQSNTLLNKLWINPLFYFRHLRRVTRSHVTLYDVPIHKLRHAVLGILRFVDRFVTRVNA